MIASAHERPPGGGGVFAPRRLQGRLHSIALAAVLVPIALLASSFHTRGAYVQDTIDAQEVQRLRQLSDLETDPVMEEGTGAEQRNELIPFARGAVQAMPGFHDLSDNDRQYATALKCMTQAVYYEAANEPLAGKRGVAQVVLNRLRHPAYPNSVCGVVYEGANARVCQFSFTCDGSLLRRPLARQWAESRAVAAAALDGYIEKSVGSATHYHADYVLPGWAYRLSKIEKSGRHIFYRFPGRAGRPASFTRSWSGNELIPHLDVARLRAALAGQELDGIASSDESAGFVPGLTVAPHVTDRHAANDVGGRLDTTKEWRLSIPDPTTANGGYKSAIEGQKANFYEREQVDGLD
jgi:hypothetical protein